MQRNIIGYRRAPATAPGFLPPASQRPSGNREPVYASTDSHELVVGPTGAGKTVSRIIPTLLEWSGPAVALDVKGELYFSTALRRMAWPHRIA